MSNFFLGLTAWGGAFIAALWLSLIIWTYRDIKSRGKDPLIRFLAVLVVGVLFLPGIVIYLVLRPTQTLEEEYQQTLEEEALLRSIEEAALCPGCSRRVKEDWVVCPHCQTKQKKPCHHCGYLMELGWNICPHCGTPAPGMRRETQSLDEAIEPLAILHIHDHDGDEGDEQDVIPIVTVEYPDLGSKDIYPDLDFEPVEQETEEEKTESA